MQIPIINGIYTDSKSDFRTSYPVNMFAVPKNTGISQGYLRPAYGIKKLGTGPGTGRGGINWNDECYRIMGSKLCKVDGTGLVTQLGDVGNDNKLVTIDYSFDYLAVASNKNLYYWNGSTLQQVTDADLGDVLDFIWVDGYFMTTDGTNIVVTDIADPFAVNPFKYGSSEADPDPIKALLKVKNEPYALNRYTIEVFDNTGGDFFPFTRIEGAQIMKGVIGTHACCVFNDSIAFVGSGRNEPVSVYFGVNSQAIKIATREIDQILSNYPESELSNIKCEKVINDNHAFLFIHLPDRCLVYDYYASQEVKVPVWVVLTSELNDGIFSKYQAKNITWCYDKYIFDDPTSYRIGTFDNLISKHYDNDVRWEFNTTLIYNNSKGAIVNSLELISLTGSVAIGINPTIETSYSVDGQTWSHKIPIKVGTIGERSKRLQWRRNGFLRNWRAQRFNGNSQAHLSFTRLEAKFEALAR